MGVSRKFASIPGRIIMPLVLPLARNRNLTSEIEGIIVSLARIKPIGLIIKVLLQISCRRPGKFSA